MQTSPLEKPPAGLQQLIKDAMGLQGSLRFLRERENLHTLYFREAVEKFDLALSGYRWYLLFKGANSFTTRRVTI